MPNLFIELVVRKLHQNVFVKNIKYKREKAYADSCKTLVFPNNIVESFQFHFLGGNMHKS